LSRTGDPPEPEQDPVSGRGAILLDRTPANEWSERSRIVALGLTGLRLLPAAAGPLAAIRPRGSACAPVVTAASNLALALRPEPVSYTHLTLPTIYSV